MSGITRTEHHENPAWLSKDLAWLEKFFHEHLKQEIKIMADVIVDVRISVSAAVTPLAVDATGVSATATVGAAYSGQLVASGGTPPYKFAVTAGALPDGVTLDAASGLISGAPGTAGSFDATIDVSDSAAVPASARIRVGR